MLLFGATGAVGRSCLDVLARRTDAALVIAGRDEARLRQAAAAVDADVEIAHIDVSDLAAVAAAVSGRDVVINCAGPAHRLSAQVAGAAIAAGVPYADPGGDQALLDRLTAAGPAVPVVLQAGVQPGLSGLLLRLVAAHRTEEAAGVTAWCGGLQPLTPASVLEYLASLADPHSHPGAALRGGALTPVRGDDDKTAPAQYFPDSVVARPHLDAETVVVAAQLGLRDVVWMNVFDGRHTTRAMQLLALDDERRRGADLDAVLAAAKLDLFGRRPYFAIVGSAGSTTVAFTCPDSYRITGAATAYAAQHITEMPAGAQPFWSVDEPHRVLDFVTEVVPEAELICFDNSPRQVIEEGSL